MEGANHILAIEDNATTVLVVDDEPAILQMLGMALPHYGFVARLATTGRKAVEIYRRHHESIDVVLLDVQMNGMDGPQTLAALQVVNPAVRCCFMSASTGNHSPADLMPLGAAHFFQKPFHSLASLACALRQVATSEA